MFRIASGATPLEFFSTVIGGIFAGSSEYAGGVKADGVTDDSAAIKAVFAQAATLAASGMRGTLWLPAGDIICDATCQNLYAPTGWTVRGAGMGTTRLKWASPQTGSLTKFIGGTTTRTDVSYQDFSIIVDHGTGGDYDQTSDYPFYEQNITNWQVDRIEVAYSRVMGIVGRSINSPTITGCRIHHCARDGINIASCRNARVVYNDVYEIDDDGIASHSEVYFPMDGGTVIANNTVRFSQGIKAFGAVATTIANNNISFFFGQGISIESQPDTGGLEGVNSSHRNIIKNNNLSNPVDRRYIDGLNEFSAFIRVGGTAPKAGSLPVIPGENNPATGLIASPYQYLGNNSSNAGSSNLPIPGNYGLIISGNNMFQGLYPMAAISALGQGSFWTRSGPIDPAITSTYLRQNAISVAGGLTQNVLIEGNNAQNVDAFIGLAADSVCRGWNVTANNVFDANGNIIVNGGNTANHDIISTGNIINIDPFHQHSNRGTTGGWLVDGAPTADLIQNAFGFTFKGNTYANCCRVSDRTGTAALSGNIASYRDCILYAVPLAGGFSTTNKGIGNWPTAGGFILEARDCDPNSATFRHRLNSCPSELNTMPTSGYYARGHLVWNVANTAALQVNFWRRLTYGNGHVLGTDWEAVT